MTFEISCQLKMIHNVNSKTVILHQDSCIEHLTSGAVLSHNQMTGTVFEKDVESALLYVPCANYSKWDCSYSLMYDISSATSASSYLCKANRNR